MSGFGYGQPLLRLRGGGAGTIRCISFNTV